MANTPIPYEPATLETSRALIETLQAPRLRAGGPSSSGLLNRLLAYVKRDLLRLGTESADVSDQVRVLALAAHAQNAGIARQCLGLQAQVDGLTANGDASRAVADFYGNALTVSDLSQTTCDVNPLFGQATLPAISRRSLLTFDRTGEAPVTAPGTRLSIALQPGVTATGGATAPPDYAFGEDAYAAFALDTSTAVPWIVEDPTPTGHVAWVEIALPGDVTGSYLCNELELVPNPAFTASLFAVQADVLGLGWTDVDFSYLGNYDGATRSVLGLGPSRLCFAQASVRRFRLGLWAAGCFGFSSVRVLKAVYAPSALLAVDFSAKTGSPLVEVLLQGKDPARLGYLTVTPSSGKASVTLVPLGPASETPVITSVAARW